MEAGSLISGKYRLLRLLGSGSMGSVWAARNELTNRDFAIKFLLPEQSQKQDAINRFFLEARACGQIRHPAIVDVYDMGQADDGAPFLVMELLEGEGFDQRISRQGRFRPVDACRYIALVSRGLEEAHTRGLIHRDLKPGNIFFAINKSGEIFPKVLDFGISKETHAEHFDFVKTSTGAVLGSPAYMSPEQASGELDIDARTDIWALGVILYESLAGELPFDANNYNALMLAIITQPHRPLQQVAPGVPPQLSALVDQLLEKDRTKRVSSAGELAQRLERVYATMTNTPLSLPERPPTSIPPLTGGATTQQGWMRGSQKSGGTRRISPVMMVGALAVLGLIGGGVALRSARSEVRVTPASRMGATIDAIAARANAAHTEAEADAKELETQKKLELAQQRVEDAEKEQRELKKKRSTARKTGATGTAPSKPPSQSSHGVVTPGF